MHPKKRGANDWGTVFGGGLMSTSRGGQITGSGANGGLIVCDDLLKGYKEARSKAVRDDTHGYLTTDVMSRIEGGASIIVMNTRWSDDDSIGRLKEDPMGYPWEHINMPAVGDANGDPIDERLFPELAIPLWLDVDSANPGSYEAAMAWYALARGRGEYQWWSLYQGAPRSEKSKLFQEPARYTLPGSKTNSDAAQPFDWTGKRGCIILDPAATKKTTADFSAIGCVAMEGFKENARGYLVDAHKEQMTVPAAARMALEWQRRYGLPLVIESVGAFKAVGDIVRELAPGIDIEEPPMFGDKFTRAQPLSAAWNDGRFLLPTAVDIAGRPLAFSEWIDDTIRVARSFTGVNDPEDDLVDMMAHGWNFLATKVDVVSKWKAMSRHLRR